MGGAQIELRPGALEELVIFRIGPRPPTFDVADAQFVEQAGDAQLVGDAERDTFLLRPVSQRGVVDLELGLHWSSGNKKPSAGQRVSGTRRDVACT